MKLTPYQNTILESLFTGGNLYQHWKEDWAAYIQAYWEDERYVFTDPVNRRTLNILIELNLIYCINPDINLGNRNYKLTYKGRIWCISLFTLQAQRNNDSTH